MKIGNCSTHEESGLVNNGHKRGLFPLPLNPHDVALSVSPHVYKIRKVEFRFCYFQCLCTVFRFKGYTLYDSILVKLQGIQIFLSKFQYIFVGHSRNFKYFDERAKKTAVC